MAASTASSGHVRKRQFQPSIDSYFNRDGNLPHRSKTEPPPTHTLPAETQASLLSVGMRVRKSVPEGYKTHKTIGVHISPIASSAPPRTRGSTKQRYGDVNQRELMPMCGLHKTGGFASQLVTSSAPAAMHIESEGSDWDEDNLPDLSASQSTLYSTTDSFTSPSFASSRKRGYDEEMEDDLDTYFNNDMAMDSPTPGGVINHARPIARMKLPHRGEARRVVAVAGENDFDEAAFLVPDGMEVDGV